MPKRIAVDLCLLSIILIGLVLRLHKFDAPIVDGDSYRQGATASIARNYYEGGYGLFDPRITGWGTVTEPGVWPNEFPIYPYLVAKIYLVTGEREWVGRAITILFCLIGAVGLYDLVKRYDCVITARFAALWFLISPQLIYHGRCFHRHPAALGLILLALAAFARWVDNPRFRTMVVAASSGCLALLMVPPLITFAAPAFWMYYKKYDWKVWKSKTLIVSTILMLIPSLAWYGWALHQPASYSLNSLGRETFRNWTSLYYYTLWWKYDFFRVVFSKLWFYTLGPIGLFLSLIGLFVNRGKIPSLPIVWTGTILLYYIIDLHPIVIAPHLVYYLIILPPLCWGAARFSTLIYNNVKEIANSTIVPCISLSSLFVAVILISNVFYWDKVIQPWYELKHTWLQAAEMIRENTPEDAKLVVDVFDPSFLYYSKRQGIAKHSPDLTKEMIQLLESEGATHLAIVQQQEFFKKDALRFYLKDTAENILINDTIRLYQLRMHTSNQTNAKK